MPKREQETTIAALSCVAAVCFFCSVPVMLRHLRLFLDPWTVNAVRYSTSALFWLPFVIVLSRRQGRGPAGSPGSSVWRAALIPTVCNLFGQVGWAVAPYFVEAPTIGFVMRLSFLFTVVLGFLFIPAERLLARKPLFFVGAICSLVGVFVIYMTQLLAEEFTLGKAVGLAILLWTAISWGAYAVSVSIFMRR